MESIRIRAHAKLNLWLRVLDRRPDGYHEIETVFHGIDVADDIEVTVAQGDSIVVEMSFAKGIEGVALSPESNLAYVAANRLAARAGVARGAHIAITKGIPLGAGLGGGSADAAGVLVALNELWQTGLSGTDLHSLGAGIGSDVPFLLRGGTAIGTGRGERLSPVASATILWLVLGISRTSLSTAEVYNRWSATETTTRSGSSAIVEAMQSGDAAVIASLLHNDLAVPATELRPELDEAVAAMLDAGALGACISGSGPTVFGVARARAHAERVATALSGRFDAVEVARSVPRSIEILERHHH